jgi:hypothetical protein
MSSEIDLTENSFIREVCNKGSGAEVFYIIPPAPAPPYSLIGNYERNNPLRTKKTSHGRFVLGEISKSAEHSLPLFLLIKTLL